MDRVLSNKEKTARKDYPCLACDAWFDSGWTLEDLDTDEQREAVKAAQADGWKVRNGTRYINQTGIYEGEFYSVKMRLDMDAVCQAHNLYPEP